MNRISLSLLALAALPLAAQDSGFSAGGGLIVAPKTYFGAYDKVVHNNLGYFVNGGYQLSTSQAEVSARLSLTVAFMPGKTQENSDLKTSLTLFQVSGDLLVPTPVNALHGVIGASLNKYSASFSGTESTDPADEAHHFPIKDASGIKGGFRLGLEYNLNKSVNIELLFQQTELGGQNANDPVIRVGGANPSWLQLGVRYNF